MIQKEAWYREALEKEYQRALKGLPGDLSDPQGQEAFEQLKKLYLRTGKLPPGVGDRLYQWVLERAQRGEYYPDDLKILWGGTTAFPDVPIKVVLDTPPEYLPKVKVSYRSSTLNIRRLKEEGDPPYSSPPYVSDYLKEEGVLTEEDLAPSQLVVTKIVDDKEIPISEFFYLLRQHNDEKFGKWSKRETRRFEPTIYLTRDEKGKPAIDEYSEPHVEDYVKKNPPPIDIAGEFISVNRVYDPPVSSTENLMELLGLGIKHPEAARSFVYKTEDWLREMGAI